MSLKHLPKKEFNNNSKKNYNSKRENNIRQSMILQEKNQQEQTDYKLIISEIKKVEAFDPDCNFINMVTENLPDKYTKKEKPIFEVFSLLVIFIPAFIVTVFFLNSYQLNFSSFRKILNPISSILSSNYDSLTSFHFIYENKDVFGLFIIYIIIFSLLNWFFVHRKQILKN